MPAASDQFMDVVPEFTIEWKTDTGFHNVSKIEGRSKAILTDLRPGTTYYIRVQVSSFSLCVGSAHSDALTS